MAATKPTSSSGPTPKVPHAVRGAGHIPLRHRVSRRAVLLTGLGIAGIVGLTVLGSNYNGCSGCSSWSKGKATSVSSRNGGSTNADGGSTVRGYDAVLSGDVSCYHTGIDVLDRKFGDDGSIAYNKILIRVNDLYVCKARSADERLATAFIYRNPNSSRTTLGVAPIDSEGRFAFRLRDEGSYSLELKTDKSTMVSVIPFEANTTGLLTSLDGGSPESDQDYRVDWPDHNFRDHNIAGSGGH